MYEITNGEYQKIVTDRLSYQNQLFFEFISKLILQGKITLEEIPQELRIKNCKIYISALRVSRNNCKSLIEILKMMLSDIEKIELKSDKDEIIELFFYDYQILLDNYLDDKQVENFKKFIPKEILEICS